MLAIFPPNLPQLDGVVYNLKSFTNKKFVSALISPTQKNATLYSQMAL